MNSNPMFAYMCFCWLVLGVIAAVYVFRSCYGGGNAKHMHFCKFAPCYLLVVGAFIGFSLAGLAHLAILLSMSLGATTGFFIGIGAAACGYRRLF